MLSGINTVVFRQYPMESMQFGQDITQLLCHIIQADYWGPVFISNVYLDNAYTIVWLMLEDIMHFDFVSPLENDDW